MSQADFIQNMCLALEQTSSTDNQKRIQAESYIHQVSVGRQ